MATTTEGILPFSVESVVENVLQKHGSRLSDTNFASRRAEEASSRRYEAAGWIRMMVGFVGGKDIPDEPSEEEFRLGLRSGIILCNVLNKVQPGAVPKVIEGPCDSVVIPDGAALCAYQYFENVRNFLVAIEEMGIPTFEASDLEQGGKSSRIVNCVLALKSYSEWKQGGGNRPWKFGGNLKPSSSGKYFVRKNSDLFMNFSRSMSMNDKISDGLCREQCVPDHELSTSGSLNTLVRAVLSNRKPEEIPMVVESVLSKVAEEFERRLTIKNEMVQTNQRKMPSLAFNNSVSGSPLGEIKMGDNNAMQIKDNPAKDYISEESKINFLKQQMLVEQQQRNIQELKHNLHTTKSGMQSLQIKCQEELNCIGKHLSGLAHAASGYHRVLEENRKLYNQVQDLKGNIRVYCRVRPFLPGAGHLNQMSNVGHIEEGNITIMCPKKYAKEGMKSFTFNKVFGPSSTQGEVFSDMQPLVRSVLDGFNVCIFAYGQTGSGKTFTMTGPKDLTEETMGVNYRALSDLFLLSEQRKDIFSYDVSVQMIEIYNEQVRDLLVTDGFNRRLEIRNSSQNEINVPDASIVPVSSTSDVIHVMDLGHKNRAVSATTLNDRSSRSHSCLTVHVQGRDLTTGNVLRGCMHLVDLAGSERVDKSEVTGDRLKEAQHINKSLSALGDVISSLAQKNSHVPYRNSKLTQLLQDSLGGQAKTLMFVHISPEPDLIGETISTLKFAERVSIVELGAARVNKDSADVKELKEQVARLKAALARKEGEPNYMYHSRFSSPERFRMKPDGSSPSQSSCQSLVDVTVCLGQSIEDIDNIEVQSNNVLKSINQSFDLQDDEKEVGSAEWVDKVMMNKQDSRLIIERKENWEEEEENRELPIPSKLYRGKSYDNFSVNKKDGHDFDSLETVVASDSLEHDLIWDFNIPRVTNVTNGSTKIKKPQLKQVKSQEMGSLIPSPGSRKLPNGVSPPIHRTGKPLSAEKRKSGIGK